MLFFLFYKEKYLSVYDYLFNCHDRRGKRRLASPMHFYFLLLRSGDEKRCLHFYHLITIYHILTVQKSAKKLQLSRSPLVVSAKITAGLQIWQIWHDNLQQLSSSNRKNLRSRRKNVNFPETLSLAQQTLCAMETPTMDTIIIPNLHIPFTVFAYIAIVNILLLC